MAAILDTGIGPGRRDDAVEAVAMRALNKWPRSEPYLGTRAQTSILPLSALKRNVKKIENAEALA